MDRHQPKFGWYLRLIGLPPYQKVYVRPVKKFCPYCLRLVHVYHSTGRFRVHGHVRKGNIVCCLGSNKLLVR